MMVFRFEMLFIYRDNIWNWTHTHKHKVNETKQETPNVISIKVRFICDISY